MQIKDFYDYCIYICLALLIFSLCVSFISSLDIYPTKYGYGVNVGTTNGGILQQLTGMSFPVIIGAATAIGVAGGVALSWLFQSTSPLAISLFVSVFWTSYINMLSVTGDFIPTEIKILFTTPVLFVFAAAIIGMLKIG